MKFNNSSIAAGGVSVKDLPMSFSDTLREVSGVTWGGGGGARLRGGPSRARALFRKSQIVRCDKCDALAFDGAKKLFGNIFVTFLMFY